MKIRICENCNNPFDTNSICKTICNDCISKNPSLLNNEKQKQNTKEINKENKNSSIDDIIQSIFG